MLEDAPEEVANPFLLDRFFDLSAGGVFSLFDLGVGLVLGSVLTFALIQTYKTTHHGATYSAALLQALFILAACTTLIMIVIGSNIARAFSLVGALSIVRFRTAIKDPRDVGFVFAALAIGMACGTGFYPAAILFTVFLCLLMLLLSRFSVGEAASTSAVIRASFAAGAGEPGISAAEQVMRGAEADPILINRIADAGTGEITVSWQVRSGAPDAQARLQEKLQQVDSVTSVGVFVLDDFHVL